MEKHANPLLKKQAKSLLVIGLLALASMAYVFAVDPSGAALSENRSLGEFPAITAQSVSIQSGNITLANLQTNISTYRWAGLVGNVSGNIVLGDGSSNTLFTWTGAGRVVYASTVSPVWASLSDTDYSIVLSDFVWLSYKNTTDNYNTTFSGANQSLDSGIFIDVSSDYAETTSSGATEYRTLSLWDGTDPVFATAIEEDGSGFDGTPYDYQMILPEDGTDADTATTSWNLYVELV